MIRIHYIHDDPPSVAEDVLAMVRRVLQRKIFRSVPSRPLPIFAGNDLVGFYAPGIDDLSARPRMERVYIAPEHRNKGYATAALNAFLDYNPLAIWYAHAKNAQSHRVARKAGMSPRGQEGEFTIYAL